MIQKPNFLLDCPNIIEKLYGIHLSDAKYELQIIDHPQKLKSGELLQISVECQLNLCLIILRRNRTFQDMAYTFDIPLNLVGKVFYTWLNYLFYEFDDVREDIFFKTEDLPKPPRAFQNPL